MKLKLIAFMSFIFIVFIIVFILFFYNNKYQIDLFNDSLTETYYENTDKILQTATNSMAASLGALVKGMDEDSQIALMSQAIDKVRIGDEGDEYYVIAKGTRLLIHPKEANLVGKDLKDLQDKNGIYIYAELNKIALNGGGTLKYLWPKYKNDGSSILTPKIAYVTLIPNTNNMWIVTGFYTDNLANQLSSLITPIKQKMLYSFWINLIITFIILVICSLIAGILFYKYIVGSITYIKDSLTNFFTSLNKNEVSNMKLLDKKLKDEFKIMANVINSNITNIQSSLSKDSSAVSQALEVAKTIEEGNLSIRITKNPANPQLLELKDVLNNMLDVLETKIGSNMNEIERVFDSYLRLDFSTSVLDDKGNIANKGSVERVTNALGEEIRKMLKSSLSFASLLNEEAKKLNTQITNLSTSSNAQASSLEQSATAIEEITQSMQN
ncbi:cache domain-containing protein, partial [Helicobacter sp. 11S02629-2]|uniref:cache domain-containing protein n=1 Tax=Helicobacter sp. 11S02629-2 TaxID=1476195 RepID=UPI000BA61789